MSPSMYTHTFATCLVRLTQRAFHRYICTDTIDLMDTHGHCVARTHQNQDLHSFTTNSTSTIVYADSEDIIIRLSHHPWRFAMTRGW